MSKLPSMKTPKPINSNFNIPTTNKSTKATNELGIKSNSNPSTASTPSTISKKHVSKGTPVEPVKLNNGNKITKRMQMVQLKVDIKQKLGLADKSGLECAEGRAGLVFEAVEKMIDKNLLDNRKSTTALVTMPEFSLNTSKNAMSPKDMQTFVDSVRKMASNEKFEGVIFNLGTSITFHPPNAVKHIGPEHLDIIAQKFKLDPKQLQAAYEEMTDGSEEKYQKFSKERKILTAVGVELNKQIGDDSGPQRISYGQGSSLGKPNANMNLNEMKLLEAKMIENSNGDPWDSDNESDFGDKETDPVKNNGNKEKPESLKISKSMIEKACKHVNPKNLKTPDGDSFKLMQNSAIVVEGGKDGELKVFNKIGPSDIDSQPRADRKKKGKFVDQLANYPTRITFKDGKKQVYKKADDTGLDSQSFRFSSPKNDFEMAVAICLDYNSNMYARLADEENGQVIDHLQISAAGVNETNIRLDRGKAQSSIGLNDGFHRALQFDLRRGELDKKLTIGKEVVGVRYEMKNEEFSFEKTNGMEGAFRSDFDSEMFFQVEAPFRLARTFSNASSVGSFDDNTNVGMRKAIDDAKDLDNSLAKQFPTKADLEKGLSLDKTDLKESFKLLRVTNDRIKRLDIVTNGKCTKKQWDQAMADPFMKNIAGHEISLGKNEVIRVAPARFHEREAVLADLLSVQDTLNKQARQLREHITKLSK